MLHRKWHDGVRCASQKPGSFIAQASRSVKYEPDSGGTEDGGENACRDQGFCRGGDSGKRLCDDFESFQDMDERAGGEKIPLAVVVKAIVKLARKNVQVEGRDQNLAFIRVERPKPAGRRNSPVNPDDTEQKRGQQEEGEWQPRWQCKDLTLLHTADCSIHLPSLTGVRGIVTNGISSHRDSHLC